MAASSDRHHKMPRLLRDRRTRDQLVEPHDAQNLFAQSNHFVAVDAVNLAVGRASNLDYGVQRHGVVLVLHAEHQRLDTRQSQGSDELERTAAAGLALHPQPPPHLPDQLRSDRQPQPRAAVVTRGGRIGLCERGENLLLVLL